MDYRIGSHTIYSIEYHFVWGTNIVIRFLRDI